MFRASDHGLICRAVSGDFTARAAKKIQDSQILQTTCPEIHGNLPSVQRLIETIH